MKRTRKLWVFLAVCSLVLTLWVPAVSAGASVAAQEDFYYGRTILAKMDNGTALCYAYDRLVYGGNNLLKEIDVSHRTYRITADEAFLVYEMVSSDHPEFFWLADGIRLSASNGTVLSFHPQIPDNVTALCDTLNDRVTALTADLEGKTDYEKSLLLHDRICDAVTYQYSDNDQTVIGSLLEGASVCAGYARGYQLLMQTMGIPCFFITGQSRNQGHAWNLVQLDGAWYYTDVTWDDQNDDGGPIYYAYLNQTSAVMAEDHIGDEWAVYLPVATATAHNYFVRNDLVLSAYDTQQMAAILRADNPGRIYVTGDLDTFINDLYADLGDLVYAITGGYYGCGVRVSYMGHELLVDLSIDHTHHYETVTIPPSCTTEGAVTTTCVICGVSFRETLPTTDHVYDGDSDPNCNVCGAIREVAVVLRGDLNSDGKINNRDLGLLQRQLNGMNVTIDHIAADINDDGKINNRDLGLLQRLLNQ